MAEQNRPLTDDLNSLPSDESVSPLFNKMDALMARHRSPAGQHHEDIPVLTDIAPEAFDIPILTDVINEDLIQKIENIERSLAQAQSAKARRRLEEKLASENEQGIPSLMFSPKAATVQKPVEPSPKASAISEPIAKLDLELTPPTRFKPAIRTAPVIEQPVFLDLPLLDLNAIEAAPVIPTGKPATPSIAASEFNFVADDLIIDFSSPTDADLSAELDINDFADESDSNQAVTLEATELETVAIEAVNFEPEITETATLEPVESTRIEAVLVKAISNESSDDDLASVDLAINLDSKPEVIESPAPIALAHVPVEPVAAPSLHWDDDEHISLSVAEENHIEITLDEFHESQCIEPEALLINAPIQIPEDPIAEPQAEVEAEQHAEVEQEPDPETKTSTSLSADAIAELTAVVGAQLAVDIASEVEQLARQHFSKLMAQFYGDTLRELTGEISRELEERLAPRIVELVEQELISKGLIQK
ncbi:hypothetical protein [Deefgea rivuli]|uniref:hypothetical protein n=1 Tax=Deefgea rivuli TaxID=400948 RepID=UPI000484C2E7|nr:hypothetical protein [Deefgea rivuli]